MTAARLPYAMLWLGCLVAVLAYAPGLTGGFVFDDDPNLQPVIRAFHAHGGYRAWMEALLCGQAGPLGRPVATASFALDATLHGPWPMGYKLVNVALHLLNGWLVFALVRRLAGRAAWQPAPPGGAGAPPWVAAVVATAFVLHPLNVTAVAYVVQRMTLLSASLTLLGLWRYLVDRERYLAGRMGAVRLGAELALFTVAAGLAKENGLLLPAYAACLELFWLGRGDGPRARALQRAARGAVVAGVVAVAALAVLVPEWLAATYQYRDFGIAERLLTEARVLWWYVQMILLPLPGQLVLFHDDWVLSRSWLEPWTTATALLGWAGVLTLAWAWRRHQPQLIFAVAWFLAGHVMESTVVGLEPVFEHRNYLPMVGPLLALAWSGLRAWRQPRRRRVLVLAAAGFLGLSVLVTAVRSERWSDPVTLALSMVQRHPRSFRAHYELGRIYFGLAHRAGGEPALYRRAAQAFARASALTSSPLPLVAMLQVGCKLGGQPDTALVAPLAARLGSGPLHPSALKGLRKLVEIQLGGSCRLPVASMLEVFGSALANPRLSTDLRAYTLTQLASYYTGVLGDLPAALRVATDAARLRPDVAEYRLNVVRLLLASGAREAARAQLAAARTALGWRERVIGRLPQEIAALQRRVEAG